ncbi:uncharacterized protein LOC107039038 isoform X1 [Diachasma alloeum]|uniref:uncharacterized protein LOC107039038 isoform X1 n=1 Tax=Diachasma alloeum TaxID=454923 RepID=UPI0010FAF406|nr:uncharacterized protein LOC107039038 isoform X1 [Diachasma alloeum]
MAGSNARCREEVVRTIVSLLVTEKPAYNIPIPKLESLYRSSECERIPYRVLGYPSVVEFLRTIPQIQIVTRDGTNLINFLGSEKTRDLSELVARQRTSQKSQRSRSTCRGRGPRGIPQGYFPRSQSAFPPRTSDTFSRLCTETLEILERSQGGLSRTNLMYKVREKKLGYFDMQNLNDILLHLGGKVVVSDQMVFAAARARHNEISWEGDRREPPRPQNPVVVRNFQVEEEDDYFGDFEEHQAPAKDEKPLAITSGPQGEDPAKEDPMPGVNDPRTQAEVEMIINERMRFRLEKLIQNRPEGIWCAELAKIYHEVYNLTLEWQQLGFNSLSDLVLHLPDIFYCVQPSPTGDFRVFDAKNKDKGTVMPVKMTLSAIHQIYPDPEDDVRAVPAGLSPETINRLIPEDVVRLGETIGQVLIDCFNQEDKGYEEVVVCDAFTPSFFWIHLRRKILKLDTMMERLQEYYEQKGSTYNVPLIVLEKGLNVVCKFYGKWHRGIVKTVEPDAESTTTVLFYDYGTLHKYPATAMHFLHRKFSNLPAQAIPCGLYNIKPPEDYGALKNPDGKVRWSIETSRRFVQRVHDRPLVAICGKKFPENNSMLLSLTDTSSDEDVNIGEWLVNDGLAVHGSMVRIRPKNFPYKHSLTCKPTEHYEKPCKAIKKLFPNVKPPPPVDVSKLSNNKKRVSKVESLRAKLLEKASAKRGVKCPTCGQPILKLPDVKVEKVPDVAHMNGVIPPVNGVSMPPMNGVMSPVDELFEKIPHLNPTAMKMIGHWVETGYMPRLGVPSAQESTPEWEERGLAPDEVLAEAHRPAEQVETPPEVEEKVLTPEEIPPEPHRPAGEAEAPLEVERTPLHLAPPATTDDDALSEFDTVLKPQRQILQSGVIDWETFRLIEKNPKPKPVEKGELLKSIPKPKRKIVETRELFDDASVGGDAPAEELGEIKHEMIIPIIKQALRNNKKELKYSRVVISRDILGERAGSNGPVESSGGPGDDEEVKGVEGGVDEGRVINGEAGGSGEVREEGKEEFSELFEGIPKINSSSLQKDDESRPEILSPPSGLVESSDVKATVDGELPEEDMRINEKGEEKEEEAMEIKFSPSLEAIPQINSSTPQNEDNSTPRALIEEVLSPKQESNDTSQDNRDEDNSPPVEETPKNRRVLIEELSSSEDSDGVEMVSVYAELLKKSPRFLKQILHRNSPEESSELDSDDESSEMSNDEESINKSIEEIETIGRDEVPEIVETTEKSNNEIIPTESIENSLISTLKSKYNSYNNENSNENLGEGNSSLELINNEKNLLTNHVPLDNSQIPVFDAADFNSDDEEFDVYFASENKIYGVIPQIGRFREIMMNGDDEEDVINEDSSKMINPNSSNEIRTDDGDVEEVYRSPEDTDDSIVSVSTLSD